MSVPIIGIPFLLIRQHFIRFADLFKLFFGLFVSLVFIGMMLNCEFAVRLFDFLGCGSTRDDQNFVIISLCRHGLRCWWRCRDHTGRAKKAIADFKPTASQVENGAFWFSRSRLLTKSFMPVGIERFAQGINRGDSMLGQKSLKLGLN
jgi:hypothetical protein